jgi:hypothetical protein
VPENLLWWIVGAVVLFAGIAVAAAMVNQGVVDYDALPAPAAQRPSRQLPGHPVVSDEPPRRVP